MTSDDSPDSDFRLRPAAGQPGTLRHQWRLAHTPRRYDAERCMADAMLAALALADRHKHPDLVSTLDALLMWSDLGARLNAVEAVLVREVLA